MLRLLNLRRLWPFLCLILLCLPGCIGPETTQAYAPILPDLPQAYAQDLLMWKGALSFVFPALL